jgi:hypothetical protein
MEAPMTRHIGLSSSGFSFWLILGEKKKSGLVW